MGNRKHGWIVEQWKREDILPHHKLLEILEQGNDDVQRSVIKKILNQ
jgi:hypothetical protein